MDYEAWLDKAQKRILPLQLGKTFVIKDLFQQVEWDELEANEKRSFGRYFKNAVEGGKILGVEPDGHAKNNSTRYKKSLVEEVEEQQ